MRRLLVPTDFSDSAFNALRYAIELRKKLGGEIVVVHAYGTPATGSAVMMNIEERQRENADQELSTLKEKVESLRIADSGKIEYKAIEGSIAAAINAITESDVDELVVMGTDGKEDVSERFFGSHTSATAKTADVPMLVVPSHFAYRPIKHVLIATDGNPMKNKSVLAYLGDMARQLDTAVEIVKVYHPDKSREIEKLEAYSLEVSKYVKHTTPKHLAHAHLDKDDGIRQAAELKKSDLLVIVQRKYGFFEGMFHNSISRRIINKTKIPVLVLRD